MEKIDFPWVSSIFERLPGRLLELPHAILLSGQPGLGKRTTALFVAKALLCEADHNGFGACGSCYSCHLYEAGNHPDLRLIEVGQEDEEQPETAEDSLPLPKKADRQIPVSAIRSLADFVATTAHRGRAKVIMIAPSEAMHPSAANALLKMLEEAPGLTYFLLVSHQPDRLLPTIRSRCFHVPFFLPSLDTALHWLTNQGILQAQLALAQGGYAPLAAIERAKDTEFWEQRKALLEALAPRSGFDPLFVADQAESLEGPLLATLLSQWAYDLASMKFSGAIRYHLDYSEAIERLAEKIPASAIMRWYDSVLQYGRLAQHPLNKRLAMEALFSGYPGT